MLGIVYKLSCNKTGLVYFGSTFSYDTRKQEHIRMKKKDVTSFQIIDNGDYKFEILETHETISKRDLELREGHYISNFECVNKFSLKHDCEKPKKDRFDYCECGLYLSMNHLARHKKCKQHQQWMIDNIKYVEPIETYQDKKYQKFTCECGGKHTHNHKSEHFKSKRHQKFISQMLK